MTNEQKPIKLKTKTVKTITVQDWDFWEILSGEWSGYE